jgi:tRNA 2-thiouridine synthesizing protein A
MADATIDARGLSCPLPVLKAQRALRELAEGATLEVLSSDPVSMQDFADFCRSTGHDLLDARRVGDDFCFIIRKAAAKSAEVNTAIR